MRIVKNLMTGSISKMYNPKKVDVIEISGCGKEVWITMESGYRFMVFEISGHSDYDCEQIMEKLAESYKQGK